MPFEYPLAEDDVIEVKLDYRIQGQRMLNTFHYRVDQNRADGATALDEAVSNSNPFMWLKIRNAMSDQVLLAGVSYQKIWPVRRIPFTYTGNTVVDGLQTEPCEVGNIAWCVTRYSTLGTRDGIGRIFIPGLPLDALDQGNINLTFYNNYRNDVEGVVTHKMVDDLGGTYTPIIWSPTNPTVTREVVAAFARRSLRCQRRRTLHVGE